MKKLLATTALALIMAGPAFAGDAYKATESKSGEAASSTMQTERTGALQKDEFKASNLIGMRVYSTDQEFDKDATVKPGAHEEWKDIGEINEIVLTADGTVEAVIVGVGGVLGIGEKDVSLDMDDITVVPQEGDSDEFFLVVKADLKELEAMPAYTPSEESAAGGKRESKSEAMDGLKPEERQAEAPAAPSDSEQRMAQGEQTAPPLPPKDAERAPQQGMSDTEKAPMDKAEGDASDKSMNQAEGEATDTSTDTAARGEAGDRELLQRPGMSREGYAEAPAEELTAEKLEGAVVYDTNDENIGEINKLVLTEDGQIKTVVIDVGGFLGLGEHQIGVTMDEIQILRDEDGDFRVYVNASEEQLKSQPAYTENQQ